MDKATLIADEKGMRLSLKADVVVVERPDQKTQRIGIAALKQIVVRGDLWLSSVLVERALGAGVSLIILPGRARDAARHLLPQPGGALERRLAQYAAYLTPQMRMEIARTVVAEKIQAQSECLRGRGVPCDFQCYVPSIESASEIQTLMGVEGAASARYFRLFAELLDPAWEFRGRNRRPPRDPVNALLSLAYTLGCHAVGRRAASDGLETALGFLHAPAPGRHSLALDLVEPLRPWMDEWVLTLCADGVFKPDDFRQDPERGCRLSQEASRLFFHRWYSRAEHWIEHETERHLQWLRQRIG
jgi:CRISPR-associated protein Cas1